MNWTKVLISAALFVSAAGCGRDATKTLEVLHAGSLSVPFEKLEEAFEAAHPGVDVRRQAYGSATAIRQVTELGKKADVIASADYRLIDEMMIGGKEAWASWNLLFARNSICLALPEEGSRISAENWIESLSGDGIRIGMSNPNHDPCGYRTLMVLYLTQEKLNATGLFERLVTRNSALTVSEADGKAVISVPSDTTFGGNLVVRPKETDLIPLLESGVLDCLFIYRSVAMQHGMKFVELPASVNLADAELEEDYGRVAVILNAEREEAVRVAGSAIVYGVTVPSVAPDPVLAMEFVRLLKSEKGRAILRDCGQEPFENAVFSTASSPVEI